MKQLTIHDLEDLCIGSGILGSGGGGDAYYPSLMARYALEQYGPIDILMVEELLPEDLIVPIGMMGAPLITMERLPSGQELENILLMIQERFGNRRIILVPGEIGGANAFTPLLIAAKLRLPVLDADMLGRAFPKLQMSSCFLKNINPAPAFLADCLGNTVVINTSDPVKLEMIARNVTVAFGSSCAVAFCLLDGLQAQDTLIQGSLTKAISIGKMIRKACSQGNNPSLSLVENYGAKILSQGTLIDIDQAVQDGFLQGSVTVLNGKRKTKVLYQNEYLLTQNEEGVLATTPDIIVMLEENSGSPISSESLRYGMQVILLVMPSPDIWTTEEGLCLVGPKVFGYDISFSSIYKKEDLI